MGKRPRAGPTLKPNAHRKKECDGSAFAGMVTGGPLGIVSQLFENSIYA